MRSKGYFLVALVAASVFAFGACTTTPTQTQQDIIDDVANVAIAVIVQGDSNDPAVWSRRATDTVAVIEKLQAVAALDSTTFPAVAAALAPLLDKANLKPVERTAANRLVMRLSSEIQRRVKADSVEVVEIRRVLAELHVAASSFIIKPQPLQ